MNKYSRRFGELNKGDSNIAGGKGASLGEMTQAGIPVPPGFVVLSTTFDEFIKDADLIQEIDAVLETVDHKETHTVESASEKIQGLIKNAVMPEHIANEILSEFKELGAQFVAVRSSATAEDGQDHAWAGQLDSYLNTREDNLLEKVKHCWASLFTPRAIFYRFEKGLHTTQISVAVVVQKMVQSEVSGIAFSVHPVTEDFNQLIIEAGYGLGEAIVSGSITPDSYVVEKDPRSIIDINVADQKRAIVKSGSSNELGNEWVMIDAEKRELQKLTGEQILELSGVIIGIEDHYGFPCDIEWAYESKKFYIVQSRPITTLKDRVQKKISPQSEKYKIVRTRRMFPFPAVWNYESETQQVTLDLHGVRLEKVWMIWEDGMFTGMYTEVEWETVGKQIALRMRNDRGYLEDIYNKQKRVGNEAIEYARKIIATDLEKHSKVELFDLYQKIKSAWIGYDYINVSPWFIGGDFYQSMVLDILTEKYKLTASEIEKIITPPDPSFSHEEEILLYKAAKNNDEDLINKNARELSDRFYWIPFGYDGPKQNTTEEYVKKIREIINNKDVDIDSHLRQLESFRERITKEHSEIIKKYSISSEDVLLIQQIYKLAEMTDWRKEVAFQLHIAFYNVLDALSKIMKISDQNDLRFVALEELKDLSIDELEATIKERKKGLIHITNKGVGKILAGEEAKKLKLELLAGVQSPGTLKGQVGSRGINSVVRGPVKIVMHPSDMDKVKNGDIIVATMTTPEYVPAMRKASAILTDEGGVTCHAAIVSRELGLPAIISIGNATQVLKDGDTVEVDADNGVVRIIKKNDDASLNKLSFNSPELKDFNPDDYLFFGLWKQDLFSACFWHDCWRPEINSKLNLKLDGVWSLGFKGGYFLIKKPELEVVKQQIRDNVLNHNKDFFKNMVSVSKDYYLRAEEVGESLRNAKPDYSNFSKFVDFAKEINFLWLIGATYIIDAAEEMLQEIVVKESFPAEHVLEIIPKVITPLYYRHQDLVKLKKEVGSMTYEEVKGNKELFDELVSQSAKYPWVEVFNFVGEPMTPERLFEQVTHMAMDSEVSTGLDIKISDELKWRAECMGDCGYIKQAGAEYYSIFSEKVLPFLKSVAREIGVSYEDMMSLTTNEVDEALKGNLKNDDLKKRATKRRETSDWLFIAKRGGGAIFTENSDDIQYTFDAVVPRADKDAKEIKGTVGNPGTYTGPVRIIMNTPDFDKMQAGDVLVSTMTTPDFIVLMQKSGAIVTDIGGLLCHAAIVSREMNKPCVIGTKFATQLLKDGDMVEVDADNGVVRIIK